MPIGFFEVHFFDEKKFFFHFFLVDKPLRVGRRSSQKLNVLSHNSTPFGPFSV